jgi:curli production assembly/transport component CsgE
MLVKKLFTGLLFLFFSASNIYSQNEVLLNDFKSILKTEIDSLHIKLKDYIKRNPPAAENSFNLVGASKEYYNSFFNTVITLQRDINERKGNPDSLNAELSSLQLKKISALPQFYDLVNKYLPDKIKAWQNNLASKNGEVKNRGIDNKPDTTLNDKTDNKFKDIEIEGLIVDQTQTKIGHDFYDLFYSNWQAPENFSDYTIVIEEKALPQLGTQVTIEINENQIFQQVLQPRYDIIEATAEYAVELAFNYIENYEEIQKQLSGQDLQGSGIF